MRMEFSSPPAIQWPANTGQSSLISSRTAALAPFAHHFRTAGAVNISRLRRFCYPRFLLSGTSP